MLSIVVEDQDRPGLELDLDALVREGARRMLVTALKAEVDASSRPTPRSGTTRDTRWWSATAWRSRAR